MTQQSNVFLTYENLAFSLPLLIVCGGYVSPGHCVSNGIILSEIHCTVLATVLPAIVAIANVLTTVLPPSTSLVCHRLISNTFPCT